MAKLVLRDTLAMRFSGEALEREVQRLQRQRRIVQFALWACIVSVLVFELRLPETLLRNAKMAVNLVPVVSVRLVGYLVVAWLLSDRLRDRFGYGLAIGLGLLQCVLRIFAIVSTPDAEPIEIAGNIELAIVHLVLAALAVRVSLAYPQDSRRWPWIVGAGSALLFLVLLPLGAESLWRMAYPQEVILVPAAPSSAVKKGASDLAQCAATYRAAHPTEGFPSSAEAFDTACVVGTPYAPAVADTSWQFQYQPSAPDSTGVVSDFVIELRQNANADMLPGRFTAGSDGQINRVMRVRPSEGRTPAPN